MAREARHKKQFSVYYIYQACQLDKMFISPADIDVLLEAIYFAKCQYDFTLIALDICESSYQLVLYDNGSDISSIMRSINIGFAMKLKREHFKMTTRFKSKILNNGTEVLQYVSRFNLSKIQLPSRLLNDIKQHNQAQDLSVIAQMFKDSKEYNILGKQSACLLICRGDDCKYVSRNTQQCIRTIDDAHNYIKQHLELKALTFNDLLSNKQIRNQMILKLATDMFIYGNRIKLVSLMSLKRNGQ